MPAADVDRPGHRPRIKPIADKRRYEHAAPGDLVHVDIKKLGRIPDGGGWTDVLGAAAIGGPDTHRRCSAPGYPYLHHAVDDHSRLAYSEILADERKETAAAFWGAPTRSSPRTASPSTAC